MLQTPEFMPHKRFPILLMAGLALTTCKSDDSGSKSPPEGTKPELHLSLASGEVRAGQIEDEKALIGGVTARGRPGDYKIYNNKVRFIIAGIGRGTGYNPFGGVVVDADLVRDSGEEGRSNYGEVIVGIDLNIMRSQSIEVINNGLDGEAARIRVYGVETPFPLFDVITQGWFEENVQGLEFNVDYVLEPDAEFLTMEFSIHNPTEKYAEIGGLLSIFFFGDGAEPFVPGFGYELPRTGVSLEYFGAVAEEVSYLYARPEVAFDIFITQSGLSGANHGSGFPLRAKETYSFRHLLVVGGGDLNALQATWNKAIERDAGKELSGRVLYPDGSPVSLGKVHVLQKGSSSSRNYISTGTLNEKGEYKLLLPDGDYELQASALYHVASATQALSLSSAGMQTNFELARPGQIRYTIKDQTGRLLPAKITMRPTGGRAKRLPANYGEPPEPGYVLHTEYAVSGEGSFEIPSGMMDYWITRGGEYTLETGTIQVLAGKEAILDTVLTRVVDTTGWMSTDTHVHAQLSPDSPDLYPFKVSAMVVEGLELPVSTEHEAIGDFNPAINELGVQDWMQGIIGSEITTFTYGHFNAWPLEQDFDKPGNGRIDWFYKKPAETFAAIRENKGEPFIQVNHPRSPAVGGYFSAMSYDAETGVAARKDDFSLDWDGIEVANGCGVSGIERSVMLDWYSFLNQGRRKMGLGSTDSHKARYGQMGYPRTYVKFGHDDPKKVTPESFRDAMFAGRMIVSCGPFFEFKVNDSDVGDIVTVSDGQLNLWAKVSAPDWMDVDQMEFVINGELVHTEMVSTDDETVRYEGTLTTSITPGQDAWIIMKVRGDRSHSQHSGTRPSWGFTNPVFIDGNGDGQWTMN